MPARKYLVSPQGAGGVFTAIPVLTPPPGSYSSSQTVTITCSTPGSTIYYTTNGSTPTTASPVYSGPITVSASETVYAIATAPGLVNSLVGGGAYTITGTASWKTLPVGGGGYVRGMNVVPDGTMVGRTDTNGAYLYNGTSWVQLFNVNSIPASFINSTDISVLSQQGVFEIQIAASNTQVFYAIYVGLVWKSTNQGGIWTQTAFTQNINGTLPNDSNGYCQYGQHMGVDPNNANIVFVGTTNAGLSYTTNGGTSYTQVSTATIPIGTGPGITGIQFNGVGTVLGGATQTIYVASNNNGVYVSNNGGSTWAATAAGGPTSVKYSAMDSAGHYYAASPGGSLYKYSGGAWTNLFTESQGLSAFAINPLNNLEIVIVRASGWVSISYDGGVTWPATDNFNTSAVSPDIPWLAAANFFSGAGIYLNTGGAAFSPLTNALLYVSAGTGMWKMNVPAGANSGTALTFTDFSVGIENMVPKNLLVPPVAASTPILASADRPFFNITSVGTYPSTYGPINSDNIVAGWSLDYASSSPTTIVGIADFDNSSEQSGISTNNGTSWTSFAAYPPGVPNTNFGGSIAASTPSNILWAPGNGVAPYYTSNGGASWTQISIAGIASWSGFSFAFYLNQRSVTADRVNANTFYLYYGGHGVYISTNGGSTWTQQLSGYIESNSSWSGFNSTLLSVPGNAGHLFYTSGNLSGTTPNSGSTTPLYRSTNSGVTWTAVANVTGVTIFNFGAIAPTKTYPSIYIVGWVSGAYGIWLSIDNAVTWTSLGNSNSSGQTLDLINVIAADPNNFGRVYVGSAGASYMYYG